MLHIQFSKNVNLYVKQRIPVYTKSMVFMIKSYIDWFHYIVTKKWIKPQIKKNNIDILNN